MPVSYINLDEAKSSNGIRMIVNQDIPSPWSEAAKGILHVKNIMWNAVYYDPMNPEIQKWSGISSAPALKHNGDDFISDWKDILSFAESSEAAPSLLPEDPDERAKVMEISESICGKKGLGWTRRLENVHRSLQQQGGEFPEFIARYIGNKYGYDESDAQHYSDEVVLQLTKLSNILHAQKEKGSRFYVGDQLTVADIYSATFMGILQPLSEEQCKMNGMVRSVFSFLSREIEEALDPILLEHRDFIYETYLELPLSL